MRLLEREVKSQILTERGARSMPQVKLIRHFLLKDEDRSPFRHG